MAFLTFLFVVFQNCKYLLDVCYGKVVDNSNLTQVSYAIWKIRQT
jgi:hypothetical protein